MTQAKSGPHTATESSLVSEFPGSSLIARMRRERKTYLLWAAAALTTLAMGFLMGMSGFFIAAGLFAAVWVSSALLVVTDMNSKMRMVNWPPELPAADPGLVQKPFKGNRVLVTPGAHRVRVVGMASAHPSAKSIYPTALTKPITLGFSLTFRPENPANWPRFQGRTTIDGILSNGSPVERDISLFGSDHDLLITTSDGRLQIAPGRGDETYAPPTPFDENAGSTITKLLASNLDPIGRSSVVAARSGEISIYLNDGSRGFAKRTTPIDRPIGSLAVADLNADGWQEIILGVNGYLGILSGLTSLARDLNAQPIIGWEAAGSPVANDLVTGLLVVPGDNLELLALYQDAGQAVLHSISSGVPWGERRLLPGLDVLDYQIRPAALSYGEIAAGKARLAVATYQKRELLMWQYEPSGWAFVDRVELPFRPVAVAPSPTPGRGFAVAAPARVAAVLTWSEPSVAPRLLPLHSSTGSLTLSHSDGWLLIADSAISKIFVYRPV